MGTSREVGNPKRATSEAIAGMCLSLRLLPREVAAPATLFSAAAQSVSSHEPVMVFSASARGESSRRVAVKSPLATCERLDSASDSAWRRERSRRCSGLSSSDIVLGRSHPYTMMLGERNEVLGGTDSRSAVLYSGWRTPAALHLENSSLVALFLLYLELELDTVEYPLADLLYA
jgi:hypothetical protein